MATLTDYAHQLYPNHEAHSPSGDRDLAEHTVVAHVLGRRRARDIETEMRRELPPDRVTAVIVEATMPTMLDEGGEDHDGIIDLPYRRVGAGAVIGGLVIGAVVGVIVAATTGSGSALVVLVIFGVVVGAVIGALAAGGGRFAGEHAWEQSHEPDSTVVLVAALLDDPAMAHDVAAHMSGFGAEDLRILAPDGSWRSPNI